MHRAIFRQEKRAFSSPRLVTLELPSPSPRVCTEGHTLTPQIKFLGSSGYQICLAMVLRWRASARAVLLILEANGIEMPIIPFYYII